MGGGEEVLKPLESERLILRVPCGLRITLPVLSTLQAWQNSSYLGSQPMHNWIDLSFKIQSEHKPPPRVREAIIREKKDFL